MRLKEVLIICLTVARRAIKGPMAASLELLIFEEVAWAMTLSAKPPQARAGEARVGEAAVGEAKPHAAAPDEAMKAPAKTENPKLKKSNI